MTILFSCPYIKVLPLKPLKNGVSELFRDDHKLIFLITLKL